MPTATVIRLEDHRISASPLVAARAESPFAAALAAPDYVAPDFGAAVPAEAEADARRASWHYPPAAPVVDWFPARRSAGSGGGVVMELLRLGVIAGAAAIVSGSIFATLAGAFALAVAVAG